MVATTDRNKNIVLHNKVITYGKIDKKIITPLGYLNFFLEFIQALLLNKCSMKFLI